MTGMRAEESDSLAIYSSGRSSHSSGLGFGCWGERMGNPEGAPEKILRKLKAFLGNGFKRLSLAGADLGAPPEIPRYPGLFVSFLSLGRGEEGLDIKQIHTHMLRGAAGCSGERIGPAWIHTQMAERSPACYVNYLKLIFLYDKNQQ